MFGRGKEELTAQRQRLEDWRRRVPERARRFHRQLAEITMQVEALLGRWWPWTSRGEREHLQHRIDRLETLADGLAAVSLEATELAEKVERLKRRNVDLEPELAEWLRERCHLWTVELDNLGKHVDRANELLQEQGTLRRIGTELDVYAEAVDELGGAEDAIRSLGDLQTAELKARLPELVRLLREEGPGESWLTEIRGLVRPLREAADRIHQPPPALQSVTGTLNDLRGWARHLGEVPEIHHLEERKGFFALEWIRRDPAELDELKDEAEKLRKTLVDKAHEARHEKLQQLDEEMHDFFAVCGHNPELEIRLRKLRDEHRRLDRPQLHPKWLEKYEKENDFFKAIAENHQMELHKRLRDLCEKLGEGVRTLRGMPLSTEVDQKVKELEYEIEQLGQLSEVEQILHGLRQSHRFETELSELKQQARDEIDELSAAKEALLGRHAELVTAAEKFAVPLDDLGPAIEALDTGTRSLEDARTSAQHLEDKLSKQERRFAVRCRDYIAKYKEAIDETRSILARADRDAAWESPGEISESDPPAAVAAALYAGINAYENLEGLLAEEIEAREEECRRRLEELAAIPLESLGPEDREDLVAVLEDLRGASEEPAGASLERLDRLLDLVKRCDIVSQQLRQDEIETERRFENLRQRWRLFKDAHLRRYCPEVSERVEALIHGIPPVPRQWSDQRAQVKQAEELFALLDRQARRLAASELADVLAALRRQQRGAPDTEDQQRAAALVAEIEAFGHRELPPATLRMRARSAARQMERLG